ncbi:hypothetical protein [Yoonia sp.]|uniref:hypothetical protein n=1 Tax=Yoonia sp. TaxID=2212373 RepID=UPI002FDA40F9
MAVTLIEISRRFTEAEFTMARQNRAVLAKVFGEVRVILVQNGDMPWSPLTDFPAPVMRLNGPGDQRSAAANRLAGAKAVTRGRHDWSIFLDSDMEVLPAFADFLHGLPTGGPEVALCDRIDRNPQSSHESIVRPILREDRFLNLYGGFAVRGFDVADCISVVDDLEEQWLLRNIGQAHPKALHRYMADVGIVHHDAKPVSTRVGRHLLQGRCIGYWQGLADKSRNGLTSEDFMFVFRGRSTVQRLKLGLAILYAFFPFAWRRFWRRSG